MADENRVAVFTEPGVAAKIGLNTRGVGVHFNVLHHASDGAGAAVPVHIVLRRILQDATGIEHAIEIARSAPPSASSVITVVTGGKLAPDARSIELSPAGIGVICPNSNGWLFHTNAFLDAGLALRDAADKESSSTARLDALRRGAVAMEDRGFAARAIAMCGPAGADSPVCMRAQPNRPAHLQSVTQIVIALDLMNSELEYHLGEPYYVTDQRKRRFGATV